MQMPTRLIILRVSVRLFAFLINMLLSCQYCRNTAKFKFDDQLASLIVILNITPNQLLSNTVTNLIYPGDAT